MATIAKLLVSLGLDAGEYQSGLGDATKSTDKFTKSFSGIGSIVPIAVSAAAAATTALVGIGAAGTASFMSFEKGMAEVFTLLPGMSQSAMGAMSQHVKDFSLAMGVLPEQTIPALYEALSSGIPTDNVFAFLETAQKAAVAGVTELSTTVDGLTSVINAYGADTITAAQASDTMFAAVKIGKTTFDQLSNSLYNVNPIAASLGIAFGDVTSAIAAMTAQGVPTAQTTTQLRQMLVELGDASTGVAEIFQKLTGQSFKQFIASGGDVQGALQILESAAARSGKGINELFSSVEAGGAALALTGKGTQLFNQALQETANSVGATDKAYGTMNATLSASMDKLKAAGSVWLTMIGEKLAPSITVLANSLVQLAQSKAAIQFMDAFGNALASVFNFIGAFRNAVLGLIKAAFGYGTNVGASFADGIIASGKQVVSALQTLGSVIASWLQPGSPPKITPDLDKWGAEAATVYFNGWTQGNTSAFSALGSIVERSLQGLVDVGQFSKEGIIPTLLAGRSGFQRMFTELSQLGDVSKETFDSVIASLGPAGGKVAGLVRAYINLEKATNEVATAQQELNATTAKYDAILNPLNAQMQALQDREKEIQDMQRIQELNETLADSEATEAEKALARNELEQIALQQQITGAERERDAALEAAQAKVEAAETSQTAAQAEVDAQSQLIDHQNTTNQLIGQQVQLLEQMAQAAAASSGGMGGGGGGLNLGPLAADAALAVPALDAVTTSAYNMQMGLADASLASDHLADNIVTGSTTAATTSASNFSGISSTLTSLGATLQTAFSTIVGAIGPVLDMLWSNIQQGVANIAPQWANLQETIGKIGPVFLVIGQILGSLIVSIAGFIAGALPGAMLAIGGVIQAVLGVINIAADLVMGFVNIIVAVLNGDFAGAWQAALTMLQGIGDGIVQILGGLAQVVWGIVGGLIAGVIRFFQTLYDTIVGHSIIPDLVNGIIDWVSKLPAAVLGFIATMVSGAITKFTEFKDNAIKAATEFVTNVKNTISSSVSGVITSAASIGKAVVDGIKKGISDAWSGIVSWIKSKFSGLVDAGMSAIGAKSPSKMFADHVGKNAILGVIEGLQKTYPQVLKWIKGNLGQKLSEYLKIVSSFGRGQMEIARSLFDLNKAPDSFEPLVEASKAYQDSLKQSQSIAEKLADVNQKIADTEAIKHKADDYSKQVEQQQKLRDLYATQAELLADQAKSQDAVKNNLAAQLAAEAARNEQNNQLLIISEDARRMYEDAQNQALALMKTDAKAALEFFNARKAQIAELADLQRERALSTDPAEQKMLDTQIELLKAVQGMEAQQMTAQLNIAYPGGKDAIGDDRILAIIQEALKKNGISVDVRYRSI